MKKFYAIILFTPAFLSGAIGFFSIYISAPIYHWLNPKYELPLDKCWIEVVPLTSWFWKQYTDYCRKYIFI